MTKVSLASSKPDYLSSHDTKTHWNGSTVLWSAGDRISVCLTENEAWNDVIYASEAITESASQAIFDFSVSSDLNGKLQFYTIFPSSAAKGISDMSKVNVTVPSVQTPTASSFDPAADLMTGKSVRKYDGIPQESVPVLWNRLVAHADLTLTGLPFDSSESVKSVDFKVQDGAALTGDFLLDLSAGTMEPTQNVADNVLMMADELERAQDGSLRAWASFMPLTVTSLTVTLTTDKNVYVKKVPTCSLAFRKNARSYLTVDMTSATKDLLPDEKEKLNALVNPRVFEALDLDRSGLASVKTLYSEGELYKAAVALLEYWKTGRTVTNPGVDLTQTTYSSADKEKADNALKENGYRLYVNNYDYYSFSDGNGGINWDFSLPNETQFNIQKHRHQWTLPQAKVYWGTKDEKYVQSYMEVYSSWLAAYPCPFQTTGSYAMSASDPLRDMWTDLQATSRIMDQINILDYYVQSESLTPQFLTHFLVAFADAVECVRANPYHEQLSNHRVYEIQAVFAAGVMMPEFKNSGAWFDESSADIVAQIGVQFADDGVLVEMDPGYHIPMVSIFYDINRLAEANGKASVFPPDYTRSLQKAVKFVRDLAYPDYSMEDFNDVRSSSWTKSVLTKNFVKYYEMFPEDRTLQYWAT